MTTQERAALETIKAVTDCIRDITRNNSNGLGGVPNGHLWARLDGHMTFEVYNKVIGMLKSTGLVEETSHLLKWVGP